MNMRGTGDELRGRRASSMRCHPGERKSNPEAALPPEEEQEARAPKAAHLAPTRPGLRSPAPEGREPPVLVCDRKLEDPVHMVRRTDGGCDHPDCVIPLCRTHHRLYDSGQLNLGIYLGRGCRPERAHARTHVSERVLRASSREAWADREMPLHAER